MQIKKVQKKGLAVGAAVGTNDTELSRAEKIIKCAICGNIDVKSPCHICNDEKRKHDSLCIIENIEDLILYQRVVSVFFLMFM